MNRQLASFLKDSAQAIEIALNAEHLARLSVYYSLLQFWNQKINLFAPPSTPEEFIIKHFVDSLAPMRCCEMAGKTMVDIGSGAGFPAIPLAIVAKPAQITLVESVRKKASFLREARAALSLSNTSIVNVHLTKEIKESEPAHLGAADADKGFDIVISRAAFQLPHLCSIAFPLLKQGGILLAMRGKLSEVHLPEMSLGDVHPADTVSNKMRLLAQHHYILPGLGHQRCIISFMREGE